MFEIRMSVPDAKGNAIEAIAPDLTTATEVAMAAFSEGFMCLRYGDRKATHVWVGTYWECCDEARRKIAAANGQVNIH